MGCFGGDGLGGFFEVVGDFEDAWGVGGKRGDVAGYVLPVDTTLNLRPRLGIWGTRICGYTAGPEVVVFLAVVVVEVELGYAGP